MSLPWRSQHGRTFHFFGLACLRSAYDRGGSDSSNRSVPLSPTQSNPVKPNPTMAPLPGKETGKETVKFLATLDDPTRHSLPDDLKTENVTMPFAPFNLF